MTEQSEFVNELSKVARHWRTRLDARLRSLGLTQSRWMALFEMSRMGAVTQSELAQALGIEGPTLVRLLDGLEAKGLITRKQCPNDRRAKQVHLTKAAEPVLTEIHSIAEAMRHELLSGIPARDLSVARNVLATIAEQLETI